MIAWGVMVWGVFALVQQAPVPGSAEAEADPAIAEFKRNFTRPGATEDEQVLAVRTLGKTAHVKTLAVLADLMREAPGVSIRIASALVLGNFVKVEGTVEVLKKAYVANHKPASRPVRIQIIQTLGDPASFSPGR